MRDERDNGDIQESLRVLSILLHAMTLLSWYLEDDVAVSLVELAQ